ncbi:diaminopimelate epimerase [Alkalicoccus luteus]|uniref:Diaminopimelate epimerase n=1 Tax=Alkalicoccus luteus TaxID=1237094 RepID=A0A969TTQ7_9BACI|nr:diaminopimelate epimerase [Alkalicoccus luteus]NJP36535.1 diaminopimelate epimerase [Alkalicoccus luteus]
MKLKAVKCHGSKNDFVIVDEWTEDPELTDDMREQLAIAVSDREGKIGSDGVLFILPGTGTEARMRMLNSDGTEAEMCGNGLRCAARYVLEHTGLQQITIETMKAPLATGVQDPVFEQIPTYEVAIKPVSFQPEEVPVTAESELRLASIPELHPTARFTALSVPNPHLVAIVDHINDEEVEACGKRANELKELLPNGTNVSFVKELADGSIFVRTYERGVGLTNACGTAMSASALVSCLDGGQTIGSKLTVYNPGGLVHVIPEQHGEAYEMRLIGNATYEWEGTLKVEEGDFRQFHLEVHTVFSDEIKAYERMEAYARDKSGSL